MNSSTEVWDQSPAFICDCLRQSLGDVRSCQSRTLAVEAHESTVWEVRAQIAAGGQVKAFHGVLKVYKDGDASRAQQDAGVLEALRTKGIRVPAVFGASCEHHAILLEWRGCRTLADMLKGGVPAGANIWLNVMDQVADLHRTLGELWGNQVNLSPWLFSREERCQWAMDGLDSWLSWQTTGDANSALVHLRSSIDHLAERLVKPDRQNDVIWGDCNPKNVLANEDGICLIDFQIKRSSRMLDLVLLFAFADSPATYLPRMEAHDLLNRYWRQYDEIVPLEEFFAWYDDELLWRILVYGGMLLRKRDRRLACWQEVCSKMLLDLIDLGQR